MSMTFECVTGGLVNASGVQQPIIDYKVQLPDTFGNVTFAGFISPVLTAGGLGAAVAFTGSPIALPGVPGGGLSLNWILQVDNSGVVTMKTGTAATTGTQLTPAADAGKTLLLVHTITNGDTIPWFRAPALTDLNP